MRMLADARAVLTLTNAAETVGAYTVFVSVALEVTGRAARRRAVVNLAYITGEVAAGKRMEAFRLVITALRAGIDNDVFTGGHCGNVRR